jgi:hypothetical protein
LIFSLLEHNQKVYSKLKIGIEFFRSILAGLIFSLFFTDQFTKIFISKDLTTIVYGLFANLPLLLIGYSYIITVLGLFLRIMCMKKVNENKDASNDVETFLLEIKPEQQELSQPKSNILGKLSEILTSSFKAIRNHTKHVMKQFDKRYEPLAYLSIVFIHAFFAGVGLNGRRYFGWIELIIVGHKVVEIFRVKQACKDLNLSRLRSASFMMIFIFITPIGILFRKYATIVGLKSDNFLINNILDHFFAQSFFVTSFIELLMPFPENLLDVGFNWLTTFFSYLYFEKIAITL